MKLANAVLEGGGVKGIGLVGALEVAEEQGYRWKQVAGASAGGIVAALLAAGYTAKELKQIMTDEIEFKAFKDRGWEDRIPLILGSKVFSILGDQGIYEGDHVITLMDRLLSRKLGKQGVTFRDLPVPCSMIVTDITYKRLLVLPRDLKDYGVDDPLSFPVAHAVRATMSIPIFFEPYRIRLRPQGQEQTVTWVDGGVLSNFPVWLFDPRGATPEIPTFGFLLREPGGAGPQPTESFLDFLRALMSTTLSAHDAHALTNQDYARTVEIDTGTVGTTEFELAPEKKEWLYQSGRRAAEEFFHRFDFEAWLSRFAGASALPPDAPGAHSTMSLTH